MSERLKVAILAGGRSSEHAISVASAGSVLEALDPQRYEAVTVEIGRDGTWHELPVGASRELGPQGEAGARAIEVGGPGSAIETIPVAGSSPPAALADVDVVLPILHGPFGEDGTVQGLLELANVPYVGAGVAASALCMDKDLMKAVLRDRSIPVTRNIVLRDGDAVTNPFGYPVFVKPARLGSSVGISKARDEAGLAEAVRLAREHDDKVLVEEFVDGVEVEVGVLGARPPVASVPGEIVAHGFGGVDWYDYSAKYDEGGMELIIPPRISEKAAEEVQRLAVEAFVATECEGMARVDCFVTGDGSVLINELNTIPGFTATSVYSKLFEASGVSYTELLDRLIELARERHDRRSKLKF